MSSITAANAETSNAPAQAQDYIIIPAFNPSERLLTLLGDLTSRGIARILIVDDGSDAPGSAELFAKVEEMPGCRLLRHVVNQGKGQALKTAFQYVLAQPADCAGVVTVDCDGQHLPEDVLAVRTQLLANPQSLILGVRVFGQQTPLRSLVGNVVTRNLLRLLTGQWISDTQTGLRGIPGNYLPPLLEMPHTGYDFEMNMLMAARQYQLSLTEVPIQTVYLEGNKSSHFHPFLDSARIYFILFRFMFSSLLASMLDLTIFTMVFAAISRFVSLAYSVIIGLFAARLIATSVNFLLNKGPVFHHHDNSAAIAMKYYLLAIALLIVSWPGIQLLYLHVGLPVLLAKVIVESLLFFASFYVQKKYIFSNGNG